MRVDSTNWLPMIKNNTIVTKNRRNREEIDTCFNQKHIVSVVQTIENGVSTRIHQRKSETIESGSQITRFTRDERRKMLEFSQTNSGSHQIDDGIDTNVQ